MSEDITKQVYLGLADINKTSVVRSGNLISVTFRYDSAVEAGSIVMSNLPKPYFNFNGIPVHGSNTKTIVTTLSMNTDGNLYCNFATTGSDAKTCAFTYVCAD